MRLVLPAGSACQRSAEGAAELTARTSLLGTARYGKAKIFAVMDSVGALIEASTYTDVATLEVTVVPEALPVILPLLFSIACEPSLPDQELKAEYRRVNSERKALLDDPYSVADRRLIEILYGRHPYRWHPYGPDEGFTLRRSQVLQFWRETWRPVGSTLVVCGKFKPKELRRLVDRAARRWTGAARRDATSPPSRQTPRTAWVDLPGKAQADICLGRLLPERRDPDYAPLRLLDGVLGHIVLMGRLGRTLRTERGLAYYAFSRIEPLRQSSHWSIHVGVNADQIERAVRDIRSVLRSLHRVGVTARELDLARVGLVSDVITRAQTSAGLCSLLSSQVVSDLPKEYLPEFLERIRETSRKAVNEAARTYVHPESFTTIVAGRGNPDA
jgi:zinc protease